MALLMSKSRWGSVAKIWTEKLGNEDWYKTTLYGVIIWVERQDKLGKIRWGTDIKNCGICPQRVQVMQQARKELAKRGLLPIETLVVGNAKAIPPRNLDQFDLVVVFNAVKNPWAIRWSTHHWMRGNSKADGSLFGGMDIAPLKPGMDVVMCDVLNAQDKIKEYESKGCKVWQFRVRQLFQDYPKTRCASTGFAAIASYVQWGHKVTAMGFTWQGLSAHNWDWEKAQMKHWQSEGKIKLVEVAQ